MEFFASASGSKINDSNFELILGSVDNVSLFSCRLVSHKWRSVPTKVLNFQLFEAAILMSPEERNIQNLPPMKCTALSMDFREVVVDLDSREDMRLRLVRIINKIVESSWDTLEHIDFTAHTGNTLRGLTWPRVLPKVKRLTSQPQGTGSCGLEIFPLDGTFKIQDTFPSLEDIILWVSLDKIKNSKELDFVMKRRLGPVTSVTNVGVTVLVTLECGYEQKKWDMDEQLAFYSDNLWLELFPNVSVSLKYTLDSRFTGLFRSIYCGELGICD